MQKIYNEITPLPVVPLGRISDYIVKIIVKFRSFLGSRYNLIKISLSS